MNRRRGLLLAGIIFFGLTAGVAALEKQVVAGAGPSTKVVELFFANFSKQPLAQGYEFIVPPMSKKHAGGIKNSDTYLFGRTGRPLNYDELMLNKQQIFLAKVPIVFATGQKGGVSELSLEQVVEIYSRRISRWSQLGGPDVEILTIGREPSEALFSELKEEYPSFKEVTFDLVMHTDDEVVKFLETPAGQYAIAFGAKPNFSRTRVLDVTGGFNAGVRLGLVLDNSNVGSPLVKAARDYAASKEWQSLVVQADLLPLLQ